MTKIPERSPSQAPVARLPDELVLPDEAVDSLSRDPSDPPANRGRRLPEISEPDGEEMVEDIILRGVERAQEDQMSASGLVEDDEDGEKEDDGF